MKRFLIACLSFVFTVGAVAEDRSILLVTSKGVWQSNVVDGVPGAFVAMPYDVIIQGAGGGPIPPVDTPTPPAPNDPVVQQIAAISKAELKDKAEATAVAAIVNSLSKMGLTGANFRQALEMSIPIADTSLQSGGRLNKWVKAAVVVTADPAKLIAGLTAAFGVETSALAAIHGASIADPGAAVSDEALDWQQIIMIIQMIIELLKNLGILK